ncbi:MAG TPA: hypothetical protein PK948_05185 [Gemmatimonadales bacterium]|nr:hypothetical protein [Gemmatimonadales bacterium]
MRLHSLVAVVLGVVAVAACTDEPVTEPAAAPEAVGVGVAPAFAAATASDPDAPVVSPFLADLDARLAAAGSNLRVARAELIADASSEPVSSLVLLANNRARGLAYEWVAGDPRRDGRVGVTYAFDPRQGREPFTRNPDGSGLRQMPFAELEPQLETTMAAWRGQGCSDAPITRAAVAAGSDPDLLDQLFLGADGAGRVYAQGADIIQGGWQHPNFFTAFAGADGNSIIGVTFTFWYVDANGDPTDIDGNGKADTGLAEIYYNTRFAWGSTGALNVVDTYTITTHETGHSMGLGHFGKVFVTKKAAADGIGVADVKYAPKALMNAVYVTGRTDILGTDQSQFCQIWAAKN